MIIVTIKKWSVFVNVNNIMVMISETLSSIIIIINNNGGGFLCDTWAVNLVAQEKGLAHKLLCSKNKPPQSNNIIMKNFRAHQ